MNGNQSFLQKTEISFCVGEDIKPFFFFKYCRPSWSQQTQLHTAADSSNYADPLVRDILV